MIKTTRASKNGATRPEERSIGERIAEARGEGVELELPGSGRVVRLRALEPDKLLRKATCPDILTPVLLKALYAEPGDSQTREYLNAQRDTREEALAYLETLDAVAELSIADDTDIESLTLGEKRYIFRLALGGAEMLLFFRDNQPSGDVESVAQGDDLPQAAQ